MTPQSFGKDESFLPVLINGETSGRRLRQCQRWGVGVISRAGDANLFEKVLQAKAHRLFAEDHFKDLRLFLASDAFASFDSGDDESDGFG